MGYSRKLLRVIKVVVVLRWVNKYIFCGIFLVGFFWVNCVDWFIIWFVISLYKN